MKLSLLTAAIAAGAALVSAAPLRVVVISSNNVERPVDFPGAVVAPARFGHAVPEMPRLALGWKPNVGPPPMRANQMQRKRPCMGAKLRQKAVNISNSFRKMFGLPIIEEAPRYGDIHQIKEAINSFHHKELHGGERVKILPFIPTENVNGMQRGHGRPHFHHNHQFHQEQDFLVRIQNSIMSLGPWEGRAVAFVLGCGIGVLLRMFFVLSVVLYRSFRGSNDEPEYEEVLIFEVEENDARRAPPPYVYPVDQKETVEETPAQAPTA